MKRRHHLILTAALMVSVLAGALRSVAAQSTDDAIVATITSPVEGQQLFGTVVITGSARHPGGVGNYTLEYDDLSDPAEQWFLVQEPVSQQVDNAVLGAWATDLIPDGTYQLRLRVTLTDGESAEMVVRNLRVVNSAPTPMPTVRADSAGGTPQPATPGPSPTSPVQQPPSSSQSGSNPGVGAVDGGQAAPSSLLVEDEAGPATSVNFDRVQSAFCTGGAITLAVFGVALAYAAIRGRARSIARRGTWAGRDD